jgi:hypothetical protein
MFMNDETSISEVPLLRRLYGEAGTDKHSIVQYRENIERVKQAVRMREARELPLGVNDPRYGHLLRMAGLKTTTEGALRKIRTTLNRLPEGSPIIERLKTREIALKERFNRRFLELSRETGNLPLLRNR